jgi:hypothetical protein
MYKSFLLLIVLGFFSRIKNLFDAAECILEHFLVELEEGDFTDYNNERRIYLAKSCAAWPLHYDQVC